MRRREVERRPLESLNDDERGILLDDLGGWTWVVMEERCRRQFREDRSREERPEFVPLEEGKKRIRVSGTKTKAKAKKLNSQSDLELASF